ncbi:MAG: serine/threonine protein kinase [Myxococcales bacterium]|nr:serine/threonine protein kinase [Myxococcales bacterium]
MTSAEASVVSAGMHLGTYELLRSLAQGGMADVFLAKATDGRHVAVKVLAAHRSSDVESCALFLDEARLAGHLHHEHIAGVLGADVAGGRHFIAMEYVHGADLREILLAASHAQTSIPYEVSLAIVAQAAAGLDHAHRRCDEHGVPLRLVHRDVSLSNIMVGHDGVVKIVDFGIARSTMSTVHTSPGIVRGKASYMSPEQCMGDRVDHLTDVFALGIVLYELTTGARCFHGKTDFERMLAVVRGDYILPSDLVADSPPELEAIVKRALASDRSQRFPSCAAMIEALERVMAGRGWNGGAQAIQLVMHSLFGDVREPWRAADVLGDDVPSTEVHITIIPAEPTETLRRPRRLAAGTLGDVYDPKNWRGDDVDEAVTRGHRRLRARVVAPRLAA